jgi:hypothetical protein
MTDTMDDKPETAVDRHSFRAAAALITSIAGLIVAIGAIAKPRDDSATRESYETLSKAVKDLGAESERQHDDLVSLRAYLDGFLRGAGSPVTRPMPAPSASGVSASPGAAAIRPAPVTLVGALDGGAEPASSVAIAIVPSPPPPPLAARPRPVEPPSFDEVRAKAK